MTWRTALGRQRTTLNGLRAGRRSRLLDTLARAPLAQQLDFSHLYADLYKCLGPPPERAYEEVLPLAARAWWTKRNMEAWVRSDAFRAYVTERHGWLPRSWQMQIQCGSSRITVTIWL